MLRDKKPWMIKSNPMPKNILPSYSTTWEGMDALVEEARKPQHGIWIDIETTDEHYSATLISSFQNLSLAIDLDNRNRYLTIITKNPIK
ncbi:hypothetical protein C7R93_18405 [Brevibacillus fortis]|uniref:Uncharacterized protein n=1 Tax=Brevibacillus fortis TaxID=2126352 RepID=A0A2P7V2T9_9BACL|nr:hypothetical protein C7R93_18405 [Brevibacillus fortis]